jgi:hypothetical protein
VKEPLRRLLSGVFDYAGLFPPAALPMEGAAREYAALARSQDAWVLGRFVCPVSGLDGLLALLPEGSDGWPVTVLGSSLEGFRQDLAAVERFEGKARGRAMVLGYEVRARPEEVSLATLRRVANSMFDDAYIELPWGDSALEAMQTIAGVEAIGVKARTGGAEAASLPSTTEVAAFLQEAINLDLRLKLTAGLHQPLGGRDASAGAYRHGFLTVLVAGCLALCHDLSRKEIEEVLTIEEAGALWFSDLGLGWGDFEASLDDISDFRAQFGSIGTCSVAEPLEGLARLGLA